MSGAPALHFSHRLPLSSDALIRSSLERCAYFASKRLFAFAGIVPTAMRCRDDLFDKQVLFSHAPKAGGTSLRAVLGTRGVTHSMPAKVLRKTDWINSFVICAIRHPFDRFVSGYSYHVQSDYRGALFHRHGELLKTLSPFEYLEFIQQYPENLGSLLNWTDFPDHRKPRADLILRIEESHLWAAQMRKAGLKISVDHVGRHNATRPFNQTAKDFLKLSASDTLTLQKRVYQAFAQDYTEFGYEP